MTSIAGQAILTTGINLQQAMLENLTKQSSGLFKAGILTDLSTKKTYTKSTSPADVALFLEYEYFLINAVHPDWIKLVATDPSPMDFPIFKTKNDTTTTKLYMVATAEKGLSVSDWMIVFSYFFSLSISDALIFNRDHLKKSTITTAADIPATFCANTTPCTETLCCTSAKALNFYNDHRTAVWSTSAISLCCLCLLCLLLSVLVASRKNKQMGMGMGNLGNFGMGRMMYM